MSNGRGTEGQRSQEQVRVMQGPQSGALKSGSRGESRSGQGPGAGWGRTFSRISRARWHRGSASW